jgi:4-amino-4-deoxychorismate lyase
MTSWMTEVTTHVLSGNTPFSLDERIFLGEGLFETLRVVEGRPCYPEQHWARLSKAALFLNLPLNLPLDLWLLKLRQFIELKKLQNGGVKAILSGGKAPRGLTEQAKVSHLVFEAFEYKKLSKPLRLISAPWLRDAKNPIYRIKSINYLEAILARRQAQSSGADDALFFNFQNQASDTTVANLFIIKNDCLFTPSLQSGVLAGIIRERLLRLCKKQGITASEVELTKASLLDADAAFTTNALQGVVALSAFEGHSLNSDHPLIALMQSLLKNDLASF